MSARSTLLVATALALIATGCGRSDGAAPAVAPASAPAVVTSAASARIAGTVVETMDAAGYTYVLVESGDGKVWAAMPRRTVKVGDPIDLPPGMPMRGFRSESLQRTFDVVYFVDPGQPAPPATADQATSPALPAGHPQVAVGQGAQVEIAAGSIARAEGGRTVEEIHRQKAELAGQPLRVRGKVVKFNGGILGKNWLHLRDGSGGEGSNDLTVTTAAVAKVGDTVVVTGSLTTDRDFGSGYRYDLIVEDATVVVE